MNSLFDSQSRLPLETDSTLSRIKTAVEKRRGLLNPNALDAYDRMKMMDRRDYRAALADNLVCDLSGRLQDSWPVLYESLKLIRDFKIYEQPEWLSEQPRTGKPVEPFPDFESYFISRMSVPFDMFLEMEETYHFVERYHPKWKNKEWEVVRELTKQELAAREILAAEAAGEDLTQEELAKRAKVHRSTVSRAEDNLNFVQESGKLPLSCTKEKREQRALAQGVSYRKQQMIDRIAKHPDLQELVDDKILSVSKAYDIAMEREGKPRDRVSPILRMFDKLSHEEQIRTGRAIITKLGWGEEYNHGS